MKRREIEGEALPKIHGSMSDDKDKINIDMTTLLTHGITKINEKQKNKEIKK